MASNRDGERDDDQNRSGCERHPHAGGNGLGARRRDVSRRRCEREQGAHQGRAGDESEIAREAEHAGNDAPLFCPDTRHDGGVVGRLEQRIARGNDDDGGDVTGNAEPRRHYG